MTREEIKKALPAFKAYADGKIIQFRKKGVVKWIDFLEDDIVVSQYYEYRIKPEPKCRPFKSQEECWQEMHKHPDFGWVKSKSVLVSIVRIDYQFDGDLYFTINGTGGNCAIHTDLMFEGYTFTDGTPFGVKEEE